MKDQLRDLLWGFLIGIAILIAVPACVFAGGNLNG